MYKEDKVLIILLGISFLFSLFYLYFRGINSTTIFLSSFLTFVSFIPYSIIKYNERKRISRIENRFPDFVRDLSEALKSGMTLTSAIKMLSKTNYGPLTDEIKRLTIRLEWISIKEAILEFKERLRRSKLISRALDIFLEAYDSGGKLDKTLDGISKTTLELREVEENRKSIMYEQATMIIVISLIFIGITISLFKLIVPILVAKNAEYMGFFNLGNVSVEYYRSLFLVAMLMESVVGGILSGYVSDNSFIIGLRNAIILLTISSIAYAFLVLPPSVSFDANVLQQQVPYGGKIEIVGSFYVDGNPAKNAEIIVGENKFYTNDKGEFDFSIKALKKGNYTFSVIGIYKNVKTKKEISVQVI